MRAGSDESRIDNSTRSGKASRVKQLYIAEESIKIEAVSRAKPEVHKGEGNKEQQQRAEKRTDDTEQRAEHRAYTVENNSQKIAAQNRKQRAQHLESSSYREHRLDNTEQKYSTGP
jgi:hypothetical protein